MARLIITSLILCVLLTACGSNPKVEYRDRYVRVYNVPEPPKTERPTLKIDTLSEEDREDQRVLARAMGISLQQAISYSVFLEKILHKYYELSLLNDYVIGEDGELRTVQSPTAPQSTGPLMLGQSSEQPQASNDLPSYLLNARDKETELYFQEIEQNYINSLDDLEDF